MSVSNYVKLREVVYLYSEAAMRSEAEFLRLWRLAFRGWVQMGINSFWLPKTVTLPVNDNKTVTFPPDYVQWIKVGYDDGTNLTTMRSNSSLLTAERFAGAAQFAASDFWYTGDTRLGKSNFVSNISFKVINNMYLSLETDFANSTVLLEYLSSPAKDADFLIPIQFQEALISWISWQDMQHMPTTSHFNRGDKLDRAASYRAALKLAVKMWKPFRLSDAY